jgi:hypothetical protein
VYLVAGMAASYITGMAASYITGMAASYTVAASYVVPCRRLIRERRNTLLKRS